MLDLKNIYLKRASSFCLFLLCSSIVNVAFSLQSFLNDDIKKKFDHLQTGFIYSNITFNFDSVASENSNKFKGNTNIEAVYAGNIQLTDDLTWGLTYFNVKTNVDSNVKLGKTTIDTKQTIFNNSIYGHILSTYKEHFFFDVGAAYGRNIISTNSTITVVNNGYTDTQNNNWFTQFSSVYNNTWRNLTYTFNAGILYSEVDAGSYNFYYTTQDSPPAFVAALITRTIFVSEGFEFGYKTENNGLTFTPFINAGLVQIPVYATSRNTTPVINGSLPQLSVRQNGYRAGTGVNLVHDKFMIRVEEVYYNAGNVFQSYQTVANLKYLFD